MRNSPIMASPDLQLNVYLIGYKNQGESIILEFEDSSWGKSLCGVIDCYKYNDRNITLEILKEKNISNLEFVFWTHPDDDHSKGLEEILNEYSPPRLSFLGVSGGLSTTEVYKSISEDDNDYMVQIFSKINDSLDDLQADFHNIHHNTRIFKMPFSLNSQTIDFSIRPFAPLCAICTKEKIKLFKDIINEESYSTELKNKISLGLLIEFNNRKICLTGDIINSGLVGDNYLIRLKELFSDIDFFKIPHHGGRTSDIFLSLLSSTNAKSKAINIAGVTKYNKANPNMEIIDRYKKKSNEVYCTSNIINEDKNEADYGILKLKIPFDTTKKIEVSTIGNAVLV